MRYLVAGILCLIIRVGFGQTDLCLEYGGQISGQINIDTTAIIPSECV